MRELTRKTVIWAALGVVAFIGYIVGLGWLIALPWPYEAEEHALCDRQVPILLHSDNLVDVTRAGIIIHELNCGIGKRLKP